MVLVDYITQRFSSVNDPLKNRLSHIISSEIDDSATLFALLYANDEASAPWLGFSQRSHPSTLSTLPLNQITHDVKVVYLPLQLCPCLHHITGVHQLNDKRLLLIVENFVTSCTEIYLETINDLNTALLERSHTATVNKLCQFSALDALRGNLALYSVIEAELYIFQINTFSQGGTHMQKSHISLRAFFKRRRLPRIRQLLFILGTSELCFVENETKVMIFDVKRKRFK